jgi:hypothetical protein
MPGPSARDFLLVAPVVASGVNAVAGDQLVAGLADDGDGFGSDSPSITFRCPTNTSCCGLAARATTHRVGFIDFLFPDLPAPLQAWAPEESRPHRR